MVESASSAASTEPATARAAQRRPSWRLLGPLLVLLGVVLAMRLVQASPRAALQLPRAWPPELAAALALARAEGRPLHLHLSRSDVPLAPAMNETLRLAPVRQLLERHFVDLRLDAGAHSGLFRELLSTAGALGSCVIDLDVMGRPDVVAVASGYSDAERYVAFLDGSARALPRLRALRDSPRTTASQLELAEQYGVHGATQRARAELEAIAEPSARPQALERLARLDVEEGRTASARARFEQARTGLSRPPRLLLTEALILSAERRVSEAVSLLGTAVSTPQPADERARALLLLGQLEHELERDPQALAHLEQLRAETPGSPWARRASEVVAHILDPAPDHRH